MYKHQGLTLSKENPITPPPTFWRPQGRNLQQFSWKPKVYAKFKSWFIPFKNQAEKKTFKIPQVETVLIFGASSMENPKTRNSKEEFSHLHTVRHLLQFYCFWVTYANHCNCWICMVGLYTNDLWHN